MKITRQVETYFFPSGFFFFFLMYYHSFFTLVIALCIFNFFGHAVQLVGSYFPIWDMTQAPCIGSSES